MPHATSATGFQAFILCGPGASLDTFTSNPKEFPKALVPIANRPMVWYALDWCYRMGVTDITLITPPDAAQPLANALAQNPYLTSLPAPRPTLLAPPDLTLTTGTAELFRLPAVQDAITSDFIILPCDLISEVPGSALLETWMTLQAPLGGLTNASADAAARRGALAVHYDTRNPETGGVGVKHEETDFIATTPAARTDGLLPVRHLALAMPTDTLHDVVAAKHALRVRHSLLRQRPAVTLLTTHRDAHVYLFPLWLKDLLRRTTAFDALGEDVLGAWAKATWQPGLAAKMGIAQSTAAVRRKSLPAADGDALDAKLDLHGMSSTSTTKAAPPTTATPRFASRVTTTTPTAAAAPTTVPALLTYLHPSATPATPLLRRADTVPLLLALSLHLATLPAADDPAATGSPLAHAAKVHATTPLPPQTSVARADCLLDANVALGAQCTVVASVVGAGCSVGVRARLKRCVLMEGAVVEDGCVLEGCVLGRRCRVGKGARLDGCQVQGGFLVEAGAVGKGEVFRGFEGGDGLEGAVEEDED